MAPGRTPAVGDSVAIECLDIYIDRLARSLASIINVLDPDAIVLAGGLFNLTRLYPALPPLLKSYTFSADTGTPILRVCTGIPAACTVPLGYGHQWDQQNIERIGGRNLLETELAVASG